MGKKLYRIIFTFISLFLLTGFILPRDAAAQTQKPRVAVLPPEAADSSNIQLQVISERVTETAMLALRFIDEYELVKDLAAVSGYDKEVLRRYCEKEGIDSLVYGKTEEAAGGSFLIEMSVYNRETESVSLTRKETAETVLDIFDAADRITLSLIEGFSGRHIAFGSIALGFAGDRGSFIPSIDGEEYPADTFSFPKVLTGERTVTIKQKRMFETVTIYSEKITVNEGMISEVKLDVPYLLESEQAAISEQEKIIERHSENRRRRDQVEKAYGTIDAFLEDTSYNESLAELREKYRAEQSAWKEMIASQPEKEKREVILGLHGGVSVSMLNSSGIDGDTDAAIYPDTDLWNSQANNAPVAGFDLQIQLFENLYLQMEYNKKQLVFYKDDIDEHYLMIDEIPVMLKYMFKSGNSRLSLLMGFSFSTVTEYSGLFEYGEELPGINDFSFTDKNAFGSTFGIEYSHKINRHILSAALRVTSTKYVDYYIQNEETSSDADVNLRADTLEATLGYGYNFGGSGNTGTDESRKKWLLPAHAGYFFPSAKGDGEDGSPVLTGGILYGLSDNFYLGMTVLGFREGGAPMLSAAWTKDRDKFINNVSAMVLPMFDETVILGSYGIGYNSLGFAVAAGGPLTSFLSDGIWGFLIGYYF